MVVLFAWVIQWEVYTLWVVFGRRESIKARVTWWGDTGLFLLNKLSLYRLLIRQIGTLGI